MAKRLNKGLVGGLAATLAMLIVILGVLFITNLPGQDPEVHAKAADDLMERGEYESAMKMYQRAYTKRGDRPAGPFLIKASEAALKVPRRDSVGFAITFLDTAINQDPKFEPAHRKMIELRLELAELARKIGQENISYWQELFDAAKKAIELLPDLESDPEVLYARGYAYLNLQSNDSTFKQKGLDDLRKAYDIDPSNADVAERLALSYYGQAKEKEAAREYSAADSDIETTRQLLASSIAKAKADGDADGAARLTLVSARIDLLEGNPDACIEKVTRIIESDASQTLAHLFLGELFQGRVSREVPVDLERAASYLNKGLEIAPDDGSLYLSLGRVYQQQRAFEKDDKAKRLEWIDKELSLYESGLDKIEYTKNFFDQDKKVARLTLIQQLCRQELSRAELLRDDESRREKALVAAESWVDRMAEEIPDTNPQIKFLNSLVAGARGKLIQAIKEGEEALKGLGNSTDYQIFAHMGDLYLRRGVMGRAEEMYRKALQLQPGAASLYRGLGYVLVNQARYTEALKFLKPDRPPALREALLNDPVATQLRVEVYTQLNQSELAQAEADRLDTAAPTTGLTNIRLMITNDRCDEALAAARELYEANTSDETKLDFLIDSYIRCERRTEGRAYFAARASDNPTDATLQRAVLMLEEDSSERIAAITDWLKSNKDGVERELALAAHYRANDMFDKELAALKDAEKMAPEDPRVLDMRFTHALRTKEWETAASYADRIAKIDLDGAGGLLIRGRLYVAQSEHYRNEDDMDACRETAKTAIELLNQGLDEYPNNSLGWTYLAQCYLFLNDVSQAKLSLERAIEINPNNGLASKIRSRLAYVEDDQPTFRKYLAKAARVMPDDEWVNRMSFVAREQENPAEAISDREVRRQEAPDDVQNLVMLARLYKDEEVAQYRKSEEIYREALKAEPDNLNLVREVAEFFASEKVNLPQEGEQLLKDRLQAEKELVNKAEVAMALGKFYADQDRFATADRHFQMAISFDDSARMIGIAADFYRRSRRYDKALELYDSIIQSASKPDAAVTESELKIASKQRIAIMLTLQRYDQAKVAIDDFVAKFPKDEQGIIFEGAYHLYGGDIDKALAAFDRHLRDDPQNATALWQRGRLYLLQGDYRRAIDDLKLSKAERPDGFEYRHRMLLADALLADALRKGEAGNEAALELQDVLKNHPEQEPVAQKLVDIYTRMRPPQYEAAESLIYRYMQDNPGNYQWPMLLGEFGQLSGDKSKQIQGYRRAAEVSNYSKDALNSYFRTLRETGRCTEIVDAALTKVPAERLDRSAPALSALAFCYGQTGEADKVLPTFNRAQAAAGNNFQAYNAILQDLIATLGLETALSQMETAVANEPTNLVARRALVHLRFVNGDLDGALDACDTIIKQTVRDGDRLFASIAKGMLYDAKEQYTDARGAYEAALKIDDSHPLALNNISYLLAEKLNQPTEALPYARRAAKIKPNDSGILDTYGWILAQTDQLGEASGTLLRAIEIDNENIDAMVHLGLVHEMRGEKDKAIKRLQQAKEFIDQRSEKDELMKKRMESYRSKIEETLARLT